MTINFIKEIPEDMFTNFNEIGTGSFSDIFSANHVKTNTEVALKISLITNSDEINIMEQEIKINKTLNHPFICKFFTEFDTPHLRVLSMELIDGITALEFVNKRNGLTIPDARKIFTQLLISIEYLHKEAHITHRDLKLENIMIDRHNHIRLIDFGFSSKNSIMSTCCGSIPYCAPEILSGQRYSKEADIWSMGIVLYSLVNGQLPFNNSNIKNLIYDILNKKIFYPENFPGDLCDLLSKMLNKDPQERITLEMIKNHPFIKNERIFQIDYKRLFSPSKEKNEIEYSIRKVKCYKHHKNIKTNVNPILRNSQSKTLYTQANYALKNDLHEKVNLRTDNIESLIKSRQNYSDDLNTLIQLAFDQNSKYLLPDFKTRKAAIPIVRSDEPFYKNNRFVNSPNQLKLDGSLIAASKNQLDNNGDVMSSRPFQIQKPPNFIQKDLFSEAMTARTVSMSPPLNKNLNLLNFRRIKSSEMALKKKICISQNNEKLDVISED